MKITPESGVPMYQLVTNLTQGYIQTSGSQLGHLTILDCPSVKRIPAESLVSIATTSLKSIAPFILWVYLSDDIFASFFIQNRILVLHIQLILDELDLCDCVARDSSFQKLAVHNSCSV